MKNTGAVIMIAYIIYVTFISYLMFAIYGDQIVVIQFTHFDMPTWLSIISGAWLVWLFEAIVDFFGLLVFTISGHGIPVFMNAFFTLPVIGGILWLIFELIRG